jgi:hypothetical protein
MDVIKASTVATRTHPRFQSEITNEGFYLDKNFPKLDSIKTATIVAPAAHSGGTARQRLHQVQPSRSSGCPNIRTHSRSLSQLTGKLHDNSFAIASAGECVAAPAEYDATCDHQRRFHHSRNACLGPSGRRPLLQSREARFLLTRISSACSRDSWSSLAERDPQVSRVWRAANIMMIP